MLRKFLIVCLLAGATFGARGQGTILWDESANGPFSNSSSQPTALETFTVGTNQISGFLERTPFASGWYVTNDFFSFKVGSGVQIAQVYLKSDYPVLAWIGDTTFSSEFGVLIDPSNGELLSQFGLSSLPAGEYGMYLSNDHLQPFPTVVNYELDFAVVPEPSPIWLLLGGLGWVALRRRREGT